VRIAEGWSRTFVPVTGAVAPDAVESKA
jgi:hypothetical protein